MKILFIGNSYTNCNDLPRTLERLAAERGKPVETARCVAGGRTLQWHLGNPETIEALETEAPDIVVLQEQSLRPIQSPDKMLSSVREFDEKIRGVGAEPMLFITWARQHKPEMQDGLTKAYMNSAQATKARVAPVGPAWEQALTGTPGLCLHVKDQSHPNVQGTYLAACVFFASIFNESPIGLPHEFELPTGDAIVIDKTIAEALQQAAWATVQDKGD